MSASLLFALSSLTACSSSSGDAVGQSEQPVLDDATSNDPFDPASCSGPPITTAKVRKRFRPGEAFATLGSYALFQRSRTCDSTTGCGAWSAARQVTTGTATLYANGRTQAFDLIVDDVQNDARCNLLPEAGFYDFQNVVAQRIGSDYGWKYFYQIGGQGYCGGHRYLTAGEGWLEGTMTSKCFRATASDAAANGGVARNESVLFARY